MFMKQQFFLSHTSSNWDSCITRQLGYKHTVCQNVVSRTTNYLSLYFPKNIAL